MPTRSNWQNSIKDIVPYFAWWSLLVIHTVSEHERRTGDTKAKLEVFVMVGKVILLHLAHVRRKHGVMQPMKN